MKRKTLVVVDLSTAARAKRPSVSPDKPSTARNDRRKDHPPTLLIFLALSLVCGDTDRNDNFRSISLLLGASAGLGTGIGWDGLIAEGVDEDIVVD